MTMLTLDACTVDLSSQRVIRGDDTISLTTMERRLLTYLLERPDMVVPRSALLKDVWEYGPNVRTHTVRTTVNRLRTKIEHDSSKPSHLLTIRGQGYRLVCTPPEPAEGVRHVTRRTNLAVLPGVFVGRSQELAQLEGFLAQPGALVTILAPGGMGKTTLAQHFAASQLEACPGGVWFCDLSDAHTKMDVGTAVVRALGAEQVEDDPGAQLLGLLSHRRDSLVVLDNFEQLVDEAAALVQSWRHAAPSVRWLVTSRHRLGVASEQVLPLGALSHEDAAAMYVARAREIRPSWRQSPGRSDALERVVLALEAIPLAIDLAAARAATVPPEVLCERLEGVEGLLRARRRDRPERHQTLTATLELSWSLLSLHEQQLVRQLGLFRGGFRLEAAEAVVELAPDAPWVADVLEDLLDKSWLQRVETPSGVRFRCLELTRRFAMKQLEDEGGAAVVSALSLRHARHHGRLGRHNESAVMEQDPLFLERDNLLAALAFAVRQHPEEAAELAIVFSHGCGSRGPLDEGRRWVARVRAMAGHPPVRQARLLIAEGRLLDRVGQVDEAVRCFEEALAVARQHQDRRLEGRLLGLLGFQDLRRGELDRAQAKLDASQALLREVGDRYHQGRGLLRLAHLHFSQGHFDEAIEGLQAARAMQRDAGDRRGEAVTLGNLGQTFYSQGRLDEAQESFESALIFYREIGDRCGAVFALLGLGNVFENEGSLEDARGHIQTALDVSREIGDRSVEAYSLGNLGVVLEGQGRLEEARESFAGALTIHRELGARASEGVELANLGGAEGALGLYDEARVNLDAALAIHGELRARRYEGIARFKLGMLDRAQGRTDEARAHFEAALALHRGVGDLRWQGQVLGQLARALACSGSATDALQLLDEGERLLHKVGAPHLLAQIFALRSEVLWRSDDLSSAEDALSRARAIAPDGHATTAAELARVETLIRATA